MRQWAYVDRAAHQRNKAKGRSEEPCIIVMPEELRVFELEISPRRILHEEFPGRQGIGDDLATLVIDIRREEDRVSG